MPFLNEITKRFNEKLITETLGKAIFQSGRFEGLAYSAIATDKDGKVSMSPFVFNEAKEPISVSIDDTYPIICYHKLVGNTYTRSRTDEKNYTCVSNMELIVYAKQNRIKADMETLETAIVMNFPSNILNENLKVSQINIILQSTNINAMDVFNKEYRNIDYMLGENDILFSVKYSIESQFRKGCFTICDC